MTTEQKAANLGYVETTIAELGDKGGYLYLSNWDIPDPFLSINSIVRRAGKYRVVAGALEAFTAPGDYRVWTPKS